MSSSGVGVVASEPDPSQITFLIPNFGEYFFRSLCASSGITLLHFAEQAFFCCQYNVPRPFTSIEPPSSTTWSLPNIGGFSCTSEASPSGCRSFITLPVGVFGQALKRHLMAAITGRTSLGGRGKPRLHTVNATYKRAARVSCPDSIVGQRWKPR